MSASAQKHQKPRAKPSYNEEKAAKSPNRTVKAPATHASTAQDLRRVEQSSAKMSGSHKAGGSQQAHTTAAALKAEKKDSNPPIHATGSTAGHGSKGNKGADPYKGRLRHKGSHR